MNMNIHIFNKIHLRLKHIIFLIIKLMISFFFMFSLSSYSYVHAAVNCTPSATALNQVISLNGGSIFIGPDIPVGTIIFRGESNAIASGPGNVSITCDGAFTLPLNVALDSTPMPLVSSGLYSGYVYETGLAGVGVIITSSGALSTGLIPHTEYTFNNTAAGNASMGQIAYKIFLIKTGTISPGQVNAANFPTASYSIPATSGYSGLPLKLSSARFSGVLNIVTSTCNVQDVDVDLGSHEISKDFNGVNSTTTWVDSSIILTNCPLFQGFYGSSNRTQSITGSGILPAGIANNNTLSVSITPSSTIINATNGIMSVLSGSSNSALGVGIQLGWGDSTGSPTPINFGVARSITLPTDGRSTITIPLSARYIQTDSVITPGRADGKATFIINYY